MNAVGSSPERDASLERMLSVVPHRGWTLAWATDDTLSLQSGASSRELFPGGPSEVVEAFCDLADRRMIQEAVRLDPHLRPSQRLRSALALRLSQNRRHRKAMQLAAALLAAPGGAVSAVRCTYRTVDALWWISGDQSVGASWYTKRATLALVYSSTVLFWLHDESADDEPTMAFFDRRVAGLRAAGRWRAQLQASA